MRDPNRRIAGVALAVLLLLPWTGHATPDCLDDLVAAGLKIKTIGVRGAVPIVGSETDLDLERVVPVLSMAPGRPRRAMIVGMAGVMPADCLLHVPPERFQVIIDTSTRNQTRPVAGARSRLTPGAQAAGSASNVPSDREWTAWIALASSGRVEETSAIDAKAGTAVNVELAVLLPIPRGDVEIRLDTGETVDSFNISPRK